MFRKIINIFTVLVLLVTTTGITISKHYCGDMLVSVALDGKAKSCCEPGCNCCHNENVTVHLKDHFVTTQLNLKCDAPEFTCPAALLPVVINFLNNGDSAWIPEITGSPPDTKHKSDRDYLQSFLC